MDDNYQALVVRENEDGSFSRTIETCNIKDLPEGEVLIRVHHSSLNYKDALSASGHKGITLKFPHTPGIDAAGIVANSTHTDWTAGQEVIVTGFDLGMNTSGGFGQYIRVPANWVVAKPAPLTLEECMMLGTAGFTAAICAYKLTDLHQLSPSVGPILVSGATGGVGQIAVALMAHLGFEVHAVTGKESETQHLQSLGAKEIIPRAKFSTANERGLMRGKYAGAIDTVGGITLSNILKSLQMGGAVTACGNVSGMEFTSTIFPFLLRDNHLYGVASAETPRELRLELWRRLAHAWKISQLQSIVQRANLTNLSQRIDEILQGQLKRRVLLNLD